MRRTAGRSPLVAMLLPAIAWGAEPFQERNGLLVVEVESAPLVSPWVKETQYKGYTGSAYYRMNGNSVKGGSAAGILKYMIRITKAGTYTLRIHSHKNNPDSTWSNDVYTKLVGHPGYQGSFTKTYMSGSINTWRWATRHETSGGKKDPQYTLAAGVHEFQIAGRSKDFRIDRFVLFHSSVNESTATSTGNPESPTGAGTGTGGGGGGGGGTTTGATAITSPAVGAELVAGATITLQGSGTNLSWSYDANSDSRPIVPIGTGASLTFTVPTDVKAPNELTFILTGDGGQVSRQYTIVSQATGGGTTGGGTAGGGSGALALWNPIGGESLAAGAVQDIVWTSTGTISAVTIEVSTDGGNTWQTLVGSTENDGQYAWTVPAALGSGYRIRVSDSGNPAVYGASLGDFQVVDAAGNGDTGAGQTTPQTTGNGGGSCGAVPVLSNLGPRPARNSGFGWFILLLALAIFYACRARRTRRSV